MDLQHAKVLLRKINSLFNSLDFAGSSLSRIEKDLMLTYIREFYEALVSEDAVEGAVTRPAVIEAPEPRAPLQQQAPAAEESPEPEEETETPPPAPKTPQPARIKREAPPAPQIGSNRPAFSQPAPRVETRAPERPDIAALFEVRQAADLSEKLSESPIRDLFKAMSINDRLLFMNELFGHDMAALEKASLTLANFDNLNQAKSYLADLAETHQWAEEERMEIARSFIKLVRRLYL